MLLPLGMYSVCFKGSTNYANEKSRKKITLSLSPMPSMINPYLRLRLSDQECRCLPEDVGNIGIFKKKERNQYIMSYGVYQM